MKFAEIGYIKENQQLWVRDFVLKLPNAIRRRYFLCFVPLKVEETTLGEEVGIKITLPITEKEDDYGLNLRMIKKTAALIMEKGIKIIINNDRIPMPGGFIYANGSLAMAYFVAELIKKACEEKDIDLSKAKIVVIDGKNMETFIVLEKLTGEINYLSICTDDRDGLEDFSRNAYEEWGLVTEFFVSPRSKNLKEADIIINCSGAVDNYDYIFKRGAIYIEASSSKGKLNRLMSRREDMHFISELFTDFGGEIFDAAHTEALFLIKCIQLEKTIKNYCNEDKKHEILDILRNLNIRLRHIKS